MKKTLFTIFLFCAVAMGFLSCRKEKTEQTINQYDDAQIQSYIASNGVTGMTKAADTTGTYYKILNAGKGPALSYSDKILIVFSVQSFDGRFIATDTIVNHVYDFVGHLTTRNLPYGLELAILNIMKYRGSQARLLIPSHMGYGVNGFGSGSSSGTNRVFGNQCLDYTVTIIDNSAQDAYDDLSIRKYIAANSLSGFTKTASGLYYKVTQAGTGTQAVGINSTVDVQYTGRLFNNTIFDQYNTDDGTGTSLAIADVIAGWQEGLAFGTDGAKITLLVPSRLAYGSTVGSSGTIYAYSCLEFDINLLSVTN